MVRMALCACMCSPLRRPHDVHACMHACRSAALLAAGDAAAITGFAVIGRLSHGEPINAEALLTAAPFLAGSR